MIDAVYLQHLGLRRSKAATFIASPADFKVCDQCNSIAAVHSAVCGLCGAYRFDDSPERVVEVARLMMETAFPFTAGTVPRLTSP